MKLGGLFSGVGGFELAWTQLGHEVAWMCEWDAKARKVLEARFPGVPIYPDVRDLDPAEVQAVDVLTGGSPCQGFSIAGSRSGLEHSESQLFADYVRIMNGLAERGLQYAVWENVPGVLSIKNDDGERTFAHVIGALVGAGEPVRLDPKRKWNVGLAANAGRAVAWRVLDSRYFGVAQRRRRVFACVAFGDSSADRAGRTLLAVTEGVRRDSSSGVKEGKGAPGGVAAGVGDASAFNWQSGGDARGLDLTDEPSALSTSQTPAVLLTMRAGKPGGGKGALLAEEQSLTLATGNGQTLFQPQAFRKSRRAQSNTDDETWVDDGGANTLNVFDVGDTRTTHAIVEPTAFTQNQREEVRVLGDQTGALAANTGMHQTNYIHAIVEPEWAADETGTIQARGYKGLNHENVRDGQAVVQRAVIEPKEQMVDFGRTSDRIRINAETAATLQSGGGGGGAKTGLYMIQGSVEGRADTAGPGGKGWKEDESFTLNTADRHSIAGAQYGVRRLTPVECERLQSFPDGWTEPAVSDSARYKAMGNAVTVNVVRWILGRLP